MHKICISLFGVNVTNEYTICSYYCLKCAIKCRNSWNLPKPRQPLSYQNNKWVTVSIRTNYNINQKVSIVDVVLPPMTETDSKFLSSYFVFEIKEAKILKAKYNHNIIDSARPPTPVQGTTLLVALPPGCHVTAIGAICSVPARRACLVSTDNPDVVYVKPIAPRRTLCLIKHADEKCTCSVPLMVN